MRQVSHHAVLSEAVGSDDGAFAYRDVTHKAWVQCVKKQNIINGCTWQYTNPPTFHPCHLELKKKNGNT